MAIKHLVPEWARQDFDEMSRAPLAAGVVCILGAVAAWGVAGLLYAERIAVMEQTIAALQAGVAVPPPRGGNWLVRGGVIAAVVVVLGVLALLSRRQYRSGLTTPRDLPPATEVIHGHSYENQIIDIDGKHFIECTFTNVRWRFNGNARADFTNVHPHGKNLLVTTSPAISFYTQMAESLKLADFVDHVDTVLVQEDGSLKPISRTVQAKKFKPPSA